MVAVVAGKRGEGESRTMMMDTMMTEDTMMTRDIEKMIIDIKECSISRTSPLNIYFLIKNPFGQLHTRCDVQHISLFFLYARCLRCHYASSSSLGTSSQYSRDLSM
mmetsp:Transcript_11388/g.22778  ORF Transcript_11388/g.22778 Transcript_11388/m.22778 type:complete len:106 (-) Transcript_11388:4519-4836(-)